MAKYNYWHVVSEVSEEYKKFNTEINVGMVMTHPYKKDNEGVCMIDMKKGKDYSSAFVLQYLGRVLKNTPGKELCEILNKWIDEKGFRKIVDKHNSKGKK